MQGDFVRAVATVVKDGDGWAVTLSCGHESWWAISPVNSAAYCSQCLEDALNDEKRRTR